MSKVLIVDDSISMRQMIAFTLTSAGMQVTESGDGQQGLSAAQRAQFDIVIADVNMPVMDGITFVKNMRALSNYRFTPILMLTTEAGGDKKTEGKNAGATGWIVKPFNPDQLLATVKKVMAG